MDAVPSYGDTQILVDGVPATVNQANGWFVVLDVEPGPHVVEARYAGALSSQGTFTVLPRRVLFVGATKLVLGDVYVNGVIDTLDVLLVQAALGRCAGQPAYQEFLDLDKSGCVNSADLTIVERNIGRSGPTSWTVNPP